MHTLKQLTQRQYFLMGLCPTDTSAVQCSESENSIVVMETTVFVEKLKFNPGLFRILKKEKGRSVFHIKKWLVNYMNLSVPLIGLPTTQAVSSPIWGL